MYINRCNACQLGNITIHDRDAVGCINFHFIHSECYDSLVEPKTCPDCRAKLHPRPDVMTVGNLYRFLNGHSLLKRCPNQACVKLYDETLHSENYCKTARQSLTTMIRPIMADHSFCLQLDPLLTLLRPKAQRLGFNDLNPFKQWIKNEWIGLKRCIFYSICGGSLKTCSDLCKTTNHLIMEVIKDGLSANMTIEEVKTAVFEQFTNHKLLILAKFPSLSRTIREMKEAY